MVSPQPFFSPRGTPLSVYYRTLVLSECGLRVDLLTYGQGQEVALDNVRIIRIPDFPFLGEVKVGPSLLKLFLDGFLLVWTLALLLRRRPRVVFAHEESAFFCRWLKPLFGFKFVYEMHSRLPQQLLNFDFTRSRPLIRLFERLERSCLTAADAVITISPSLAEYAQSRMPDPQKQIMIENSIIDDVKMKTPLGDAIEEAEVIGKIPPDRDVIGYAGTLESYQGLELLIEAFAQVVHQRDSSFLLVIGGSAQQVASAQRQVDELGLTGDCLFTGSLPQRLARSLLQKSGVVTSPRLKGSNTPLKIYELLANGKPLVATRIPAHTQVLSDDVCFLAEPDADSFAQAILAAFESPERRERVATAGRDLYERRYSRRAYTERVRFLLERLL